MTTDQQTPSPPTVARRFRLFAPILAGATARDRAIACVGALVGIALVAWVSTLLHGGDQPIWLVAPMGASAVLVFAVPASPMSQPWPVLGGNVLSAALGVLVAHVVHQPELAIGIALGGAIALMSVTRCLHAPGGAMAVTAVLGGPAVASAGDVLPLAPVGVNAVLLLAAGWVFHRFSAHAYPHVALPAATGVPTTSDPPPSRRVGFRPEDIDAVLAATGDAYDIDRADLDQLLRAVEERALVREHADLTCADIMSRDVISVERGDDPATARRLLLDSGVRLLPVRDGGRVVGGVGLRELATATDGDLVGALMRPPLTTAPDQPALTLTGPLTDGQHHAAMVIDADDRLVGVISQSDLLAAVTRRLGPG